MTDLNVARQFRLHMDLDDSDGSITLMDPSECSKSTYNMNSRANLNVVNFVHPQATSPKPLVRFERNFATMITLW